MTTDVLNRFKAPAPAPMPVDVARYLDVYGIPKSLQALSLHNHVWSKTPNIQQWGAAWARGLIFSTYTRSDVFMWAGRGLFCQAPDPSVATSLVAGLVQDVLRLPQTKEYLQGVPQDQWLRWFRAEDFHHRSRLSYTGDDRIDMAFLMKVPLVVLSNVSGTDRYQAESVSQLVSNRRSEGLPTLVSGSDIAESSDSSVALAKVLSVSCVVTSPGDKSRVQYALSPLSHTG